MKRQTADLRLENGEASRFHAFAGSFFSELGFQLVEDPRLILGRYQETGATYKSENGLFLRIGFAPADGNSALVVAGRRWRRGDQWSVLSNMYSILARRFGIDVPTFYTLGYGDEVQKTFERILGDLRRTLPVVMQRTTLEDLIAVEGEESAGAELIAAAYFGPEYPEKVEVSAYPSRCSSI